MAQCNKKCLQFRGWEVRIHVSRVICSKRWNLLNFCKFTAYSCSEITYFHRIFAAFLTIFSNFSSNRDWTQRLVERLFSTTKSIFKQKFRHQYLKNLYRWQVWWIMWNYIFDPFRWTWQRKNLRLLNFSFICSYSIYAPQNVIFKKTSGVWIAIKITGDKFLILKEERLFQSLSDSRVKIAFSYW